MGASLYIDRPRPRPPADPDAPGSGWGVPAAAAADLVLVAGFAALGRRAHHESVDLLGVLHTGWPFLIGAALGWLLVRAWRGPQLLRTGAVIWVSSWTVGMALRAVTDQGTDPAFMIVAALTLAAFLVGWRLALVVLRRLR